MANQTRVPLAVEPGRDNLAYLRTKRDRMGHELTELGDVPDLPGMRGLADGTSEAEDE